MATYIPNASNATQPTEEKLIESAALEFRTLKARVNALTLGPSGPAPTPVGGLKIAVIGDSLTVQNAVLDESATHILERTLNQMGVPCTVVPCGKNAHTFFRANTAAIYDGVTSVAKAIAEEPGIVLVILGINDTVNAVDGRTIAQVQADALATFTALRAGLPSALIYYVGEVPYAQGLTDPEIADLTNERVTPSAMTLRTTGILDSRWTAEILSDSVDATTQNRHNDWGVLHTYIKTLTQITESFDMWVQRIHRAGGGGVDRLHFNHGGSVLAAGYLLQGLRLQGVFSGLLNNDYPVWEDPDVLITNVITSTNAGLAANANLGGILHPESWFLGWHVTFRVNSNIKSDADGVILWLLLNGPQSELVHFSFDGGAWQSTGVTSDAGGGAMSAAGGSLLPTLSITPGTRQFRYRVGEIVLGPYPVLVTAATLGGSVNWQNLTMLSGWVPFVGAAGTNTPQYAVYNGVVHFRGIASHASTAIADVMLPFASIPGAAYPNTSPLCILPALLGGSRAGMVEITDAATMTVQRVAGQGTGGNQVFLSGLSLPL